MEFKVLHHTYENTGGGCMVGFTQVWVPAENRVIFVNTNEEGCSFWAVDAYHAGLDDMEPFDGILAMDSYSVNHHYFEIARECMRWFLHYDGRNQLLYAWLPDKVQEQVTDDYKMWMQERYGTDAPLYEADDIELFMEEEYEDLIHEQNRKRAAEEAAAIVADMNRAEVIVAFENFKRAYNDIVSAWYKDRDLLDNILVEEYPFECSFDELGVVQWCDDIIRGVLLKGRE